MVTHAEAEAISYTQVVCLLAASRTCTLLHRAWGHWETTPVWAAAQHRPRPGSAPTYLSHLLWSKGLACYQNPFPHTLYRAAHPGGFMSPVAIAPST